MTKKLDENKVTLSVFDFSKHIFAELVRHKRALLFSYHFLQLLYVFLFVYGYYFDAFEVRQLRLMESSDT